MPPVDNRNPRGYCAVMIDGLKGSAKRRAERFIEEIQEARRALGEETPVETLVWVEREAHGRGLQVTFERLAGSPVTRRTTVREGTPRWDARAIAAALVHAARSVRWFERDRLDGALVVARAAPQLDRAGRAPERFLHAHADGVAFDMRCLTSPEAAILLEAAGKIEQAREQAA